MRKLAYFLLLFTGIVNAQQSFNFPFSLQNLQVYETGTDFSAQFDLTVQRQIVHTVENYSAWDYSVTFYMSYQDAVDATNPIVNEINFLGSSGQQVFARVLNLTTGIFYVDIFGLMVSEDGIVNIPDANFKTILLSTNPQYVGNISGTLTGGIDANNDGEIQFSEANAIHYMNLDTPSSLDNITDLTGISAFRSLINLYLSDNQFTTFDPFCLSNKGNLRKLYAGNCELNALYVNSLYNLKELELQNNNLTTIDVSQLTRLENFAPANNPLTSLNINHLSNLRVLKVYTNNLSTLDLFHFPKLSLLQCENNQLTTLDASQNVVLNSISCSLNNLTSLNLKNGITESNINFVNNPNLVYICVDDAQSSAIQAQLVSLGMNSTVLNTYCSFFPGGNYNTISGAMIFDENTNGCDTNDAPQPNIKININDGTNQRATFTNNTGNYNFYTEAGSFIITPSVENPTYFNFSPTTATIPFVNINNNTATQNFCISANGVHNDLEIVIAPITTARPGFDAIYKVVYKNKGNQTISGGVSMTYDDSVLDYVSASVTPNSQTTGSIVWNYSDLLPFENRSFYVTLNVNSPVETPPVNIDDVLLFQVTVTPISGDENAADNTFAYNQTVVGAFDPNDITCIEGATVPTSLIGQYLHYVINFENTGNFEAENIVVRTEINPANFDINTLQMLNTSHDAYIRQTGNIIEFIFQEIALETGGHGNILLKIKSKTDLVDGDTVANRGDIFFDYNAPIDTGAANTTFQSLSNGNFEIDDSVSVYPNPASSLVNINAKHSIKSVQLYDVQGRLLQTVISNQATTSLDISEKQSGIYFLKINTETGTNIEKIIKK